MKPWPRNPQPATRNPQPATRNPQPATRNPQPATPNPQHPTHNTQPINTQPTTPNPLPTRTIRPVSGLASIREELASFGTDFPTARGLAWRLFLRDTRAQFRQSLLGYLWLFLPPIATTAVWIYLNGQKVVDVDSGDVPYPLFVLTGTLLWNAFNGTLTGVVGVLGEARSMIAKLNFPHEALVFTALLKTLLNTGIQVLLLVPAFLAFGFAPEAGLVYFPVGLLTLILLGAALGICLVPIGTLYTDVGRGIQLVLRFAFFVTPVVYPIPDTGLAQWLATLNPAASLLVTTRGLALGGEAPLWGAVALVVTGSALLFALGLLLYKLAMPRLIERMSA